MLHDTLRVVLRKRITEFGEHAHVCSLQSQTGFENIDQFIKVAIALILLYEILKLFGVNDKIETANLGKAELFLGNASLVDLSPDY